jgi:pimeloyl-ACP methyl ester carboxylesterase
MCAGLPSVALASTQPTKPTPAPPAPASTPAAATIERWKGEIALPGMKLEFLLVVNRPAQGDAIATMSIPAQGLNDGALRDVVASDERLNFTLGLPGMPKAAWAYFQLARKVGDPAGKGVMMQSGIEAPVTITRLADGEHVGPNRPQTPKPPFPYATREVSYDNPIDGAKFSATLTIPEAAKFGQGPFPAVLLITGSGGQDRDETLFGHKPFAVIADTLTRAGIAVLRADDRGVGGSTSPKLGQETTEDFVGDALAGLAELRRHPEIDPARLGFVGHSEGGVIAPMAAARAPKEVAFMVLLAGTAVEGREILRTQLRAMAKAVGAPDAMLAAQEAAQLKAIDAITSNAPPEAVTHAVDALARAQLGLPPEGDVPAESRGTLDAAVAQGVKQLTNPWMRTFIKLDPRVALRQVKVPVLALFGDKDTQVLADLNAQPMRDALNDAGNTRATIETLPSLNHLFQTCATGAFAEYNQIEETIAPIALERMTKWLTEVTARK